MKKMTNKEKYPKTEDALKEYEKFCALNNALGDSKPIPFDAWLEKESWEDYITKQFKELEGTHLGDLLKMLDISARDMISFRKEKLVEISKKKKESPETITCPICGSNKTRIYKGVFFPAFTCDECNAQIAFKNSFTGMISDETPEEVARRIVNKGKL
jgi:hypothetical protein